MINLPLTTEQARLLHEILQRTLSDLSYEIAGTDRKEYRDEIHAERDLLQEITDRLAAGQSASSAHIPG